MNSLWQPGHGCAREVLMMATPLACSALSRRYSSICSCVRMLWENSVDIEGIG